MISHGWNDPRTDRPRFHLLFDYMGADDPSAHLAVPAAIDFLSSLYPNGLPGTMEHNRSLALAARDLLCEFLAVDPPAPDSMIGSLAAVPLPDSTEEMHRANSIHSACGCSTSTGSRFRCSPGRGGRITT